MSTGASTGSSRTTGAGGGQGTAKTAAVVLWVLVSGGLLYGVVQTVSRATQLFSG
ncbi:MFS transporter small subunit [Quadrisphaera sp. KR29]|uniref:MFS transporter small subunit n=1 Tax=Quadrisphaera sp. KR29 TaxID=3461391 RepID=UPI0040442B5B